MLRLARHVLLFTGLAAILATLLVAARPAQATTELRCFPETGKCITGVFLDYWMRNGGLAVFGYPITDSRTETIEGSWTGTVQWFERDRLEDHSNEGLGVLTGRLGARHLELQGRAFPRTAIGITQPGQFTCAYFAETGQPLCGVFKEYWERNGGLARFGYPISPPVVERVGGWVGTVQYFERRRMEHHIEYAGSQYEVLLGLLGRHVRAAEQALPTLPAGEGWRLAEVVSGDIDEVVAYVPGPVDPFQVRERSGMQEFSYSATKVALLRPSGASYATFGQADMRALRARDKELGSLGDMANGRQALALSVLPPNQGVSIALMPVDGSGNPVAQAMGMYWNKDQGAYRLYATGQFLP